MEQSKSSTDQRGIEFVTTETNVRQPGKIIPDDVIIYMRIFYSLVLGFVISSIGMTTNILNITVYWRQGLGDSVNITFIALSLWDFNISLFSFLTITCTVIDLYFPVPYVNVMSLQYVYVAYSRGLVYVLSTLVTVYLSIERCICIMFPFKVKDIFTTTRVVFINVFIAVFGVAFFSPVWATQGMRWAYDPARNRSRLILYVSSNRRDIDLFVDTFTGMVLPTIAQFLIIICALFMIQGVKKSAKFRNQVNHLNTSKSTTYNCKKESITTTTKLKSVKISNITTNKDLKLTKVVTILALIFFVCNCPVFIVALLRALIPDIDVGKLQYNLYSVLYGAVYLFGSINASVNIFVYYNVSTKYRQVFLGLGVFNLKRQ